MRWLLFLLLTGCTVVTVETPDCTVNYYTAFRDASQIDYSVCGGRALVKKTETKADLFEALLRTKLLK